MAEVECPACGGTGAYGSEHGSAPSSERCDLCGGGGRVSAGLARDVLAAWDAMEEEGRP